MEEKQAIKSMKLFWLKIKNQLHVDSSGGQFTHNTNHPIAKKEVPNSTADIYH